MKISLLIISFFTSLIVSAQTGVSTNYSMSSTSGGTTVTRTYRVYVPAMYDPANPVPLVFNIHGIYGTMSQQENYGDFRKIADTANFIIVHPQGLLTNMGLFRANAYDLFFTTARAQPDIDYISHLIDTIKGRYNINMSRIYATGMSNGGFMSYEMACKLSPRFAAVASVCGSMAPAHYTSCDAKHPTPLMEIHGTDDAIVKYDGTPGTTYIPFTHTDTLVNYWVKYNNCNLISTNPLGDTLPDISTTDSCRAVHFVWDGGDDGSVVELYKILGGGHAWPGSSVLPAPQGFTNHDFNASKEIWRFFNQHKSFVGINEPSPVNINFSVYPNPTDGLFAISISNANSESLIITIMDFLGREVYRFSGNNGSSEYKKEINLKHLSTGIYTVKLNLGSDIKVQKIIIQ